MEGTNKTLCTSRARRKESPVKAWVNNSLPSVQTTGREEPYPSTEYRINDLLSMAPPIRTRPSFPYSQSLPTGSFHKLLILIHQQADKMKITVTEN